jgi:hypothetical protein
MLQQTGTMNPRSPASTTSGGYPSKRARPSPQDEKSPTGYAVAVSESSPSDNVSEPPGQKVQPAPTASSNSSSFRNVSACNRCRLRKNRCDQRLPSCASCKKAGVKCVGYDPITKREIPRRYVCLGDDEWVDDDGDMEVLGGSRLNVPF